MRKKILSLFLCLAMVLSMNVIPIASAATVSQKTIERAYVLNGLNLFQGTEKGFELERRATRLEGLVMLVRLLGEESTVKDGSYSHAFWDVPTWGSSYVGYAYQNGLSKGVSATAFGSTDYISINQYATFILRALGYSDVNGDFSWNKAFEKVVSLGIIPQDEVAQLSGNTFLRGGIVDLSYLALFAKEKGGTQTLCDKLIAKGIFTEDMAREAGIKPGGSGNSMTLSPVSATCAVGSTVTITPKIVTADGAGYTPVWSSSDTKIATVSGGIVTGVAAGKVEITATVAAINLTAKATITVQANTVPVQSISITPITVSLKAEESAVLTARVLPENATNKNIVWSSNATAVATVKDGTITAVAAGSATITATATDGSGKRAAVTVTVAPKDPITVSVQSISITPTTVSLKVGESAGLTASVLPGNATNKNIIWSSSAPAVATVNNETITAVAAGSATITATAADGSGKKAFVTVTVVPKVQSAMETERAELQDGCYRLVSAAAPSCDMDVSNFKTEDGTNIGIYTRHDGANQRFNVINIGGQVIKIASIMKKGTCVDISQNGGAGANIQLFSDNGTSAQQWVASKLQNGNYIIRSAANMGWSLAVSSAASDANVYLTDFNENDIMQQWQLVRTGDTRWTEDEHSQTIADGVYSITMAQDGRLLNVDGGIDKNGTNVVLWDKDYSAEQKFRVQYISDGKYKLYPLSSNGGYGRVVDINRGNNASNPLSAGLKADIWDENDAPAQEFYIEPRGNGYYSIALAAVPNSVLTCNSAGSNGAHVTLEVYQQSGAQHWTFSTPEDRPVEDQGGAPALGGRLANIDGDAYMGSVNPFARVSSLIGQCTWYCWGRAYETTGIQLNTVNNADTWLSRLNTPNTSAVWDAYQPRKNSIAVYSSCHVRFVEYVSGDTVYYTEANWPANNMLDANDGIVKSLPLSSFAKSCIGYIYLG